MCADLVRQVNPEKTGLRERIEWLMLRASLALFWESNWSRAEKDFKECLNLVRASDDLRMWFLFSLYLAPEFIVLPGMLTLLERFCEDAEARFEKQISPLRLGVEDTWASIHLRRGRMPQALEVGKDALWVKQQLGGYTFLGMNACLTLASVSIGSGDDAAASQYLRMVMEQVEEAELNRALAGGGLYPLGKFQWLQGRFEEARQTHRKMALLPIRLPFVDVLQKMLGGLLEISAQHYRPAEELLLEAVRAQSKEIVSAVYGSARLLLAYLYLRWEKEDRALEQMDVLLAQCEQGNDSGLILQDMPFAGPLLRRMVKNGRRVKQAVALLEQMGWPVKEEKNEPALLTERQFEILKLIADGYSNQAIADRLMLSLTTVKSHLVNIMNRLGVSSRTEAVARARQIGLLP
jgi:ATP/maltotriose-dependent transcriptional regulator MalT